MWIVRSPSGRLGDSDEFLRQVRANVGGMKYLQPTLVTARSRASRFKTKEAAEYARTMAPIHGGKVEPY